MRNKKGFANLGIIIFIVVILIGVIFLGIYGVIFSNIDDALSQNMTLGNVNLATINSQTFGQIANGFLNNADLLGIALIFGMIISMVINAYLFREKYHKIFIILDIGILFLCYLVAVYVSNTFETLINASSYFSVYTEDLSISSTFILRLPTIISIIGAIIMILSYSTIPKYTKEEESITPF